MDTYSTETIMPVQQTQEQLKGIEPLPSVISKEQEIQGKSSQLLISQLELSDDDTTDNFEDNLQGFNKDSIRNRKKRLSDASSHSNYTDMISELEKHVDELAISQDQISALDLPKEITNKLKKDRNFLYKPKVTEEEEFESDATSDYSDDDDEEEEQLSEEPESMISSDKGGQKENDPEKMWKDFDWNSTIDLTTMRSQSLRSSYRNSGSFSRNSLNVTFKNSSLQQPSKLNNNNNINIQQWKKENQIKDLRNFNSRRVYNYRNLYPGEVVSADIKSDSSVDGTRGILIVNDSGVKSNRLELNKIKESKLSLGEANDIFSISSHKSRLYQEIEGSTSENSLLIGDTLPDKMLVRIKKLEFDPPRTSKAKTSIRLVIHSVTHQTKPNSSYQEQIQKMFLFPLDYHSFVFDTLKIDLYEHASFLYAKKKLVRAIVRLSTLKDSILKQKDFEGTFPLESSGEPNPRKVGIIDLAIKFHFPNDPPLPPPKTPKPLVTRSKTAPALLSSSNKDKNKQILPPAVMNTRANVDQEVSSDIEGADEGEFANIVTHPETSPLGILDRVLNQETRDAIKEITVLYHAFFDHGWRLSKLEFLKAYMLLEKYYSQKPNPVTGSLCQNLKRIQTAQKYLKYSMASYGSFLFNWFGYGHNMHLNAIRINSDRKAVQEFFSLEKEDIICWEYGQKAVSVPNYMVIHDPETNSIIISIRGTMNVTDVITDALAHYEPWNGGFVHRGVLRSAQYLVNHSLEDIREAVKKFNSKAIQVIGHSLGASISSIVTLILRDKCKDLIKQGINIHGWNFATAPCCSIDLACKKETLSCIDNFINENDVIPRLSYGNLMDFKELIKFAASELKNENYKKLSSKDKLAKILTSIDDYRTALKSNSSARKLYIPGTIYYLYKGFHRSHIKSSIAYYTKDIVCEKSRPDLFTDISLRKNWLFHHFPDRYDKKFKGVIKFLSRKNEKDDGDKVGHKLLKWKRVAEADVVNDEGGRMGKWMSRSGHM